MDITTHFLTNNRDGMCGLLLSRLLKNCVGMLYFLSRLYNRDGIFSTFYCGWINCGFGTAFVSLI